MTIPQDINNLEGILREKSKAWNNLLQAEEHFLRATDEYIRIHNKCKKLSGPDDDETRDNSVIAIKRI